MGTEKTTNLISIFPSSSSMFLLIVFLNCLAKDSKKINSFNTQKKRQRKRKYGTHQKRRIMSTIVIVMIMSLLALTQGKLIWRKLFITYVDFFIYRLLKGIDLIQTFNRFQMSRAYLGSMSIITSIVLQTYIFVLIWQHSYFIEPELPVPTANIKAEGINAKELLPASSFSSWRFESETSTSVFVYDASQVYI